MTDQTDATTETEPASMEDTMGEVYDALMAVDAPSDTEPLVEAPDAVTETTDGPTRDQKGRFASTEEGAPTGDAPAPDPAQTPNTELSDQGEKAATEPATAPGLDAPASWSPAAKAEWSTLPPAIQGEVLKREGDFNKGLQQNAERLKKGYEPLDTALEPAREYLELNGIDPAQYVRQLVAAEQFLQRSPAEAIQWLAKSYGLNPDEQYSQPAEDDYSDPQVAAYKHEVEQIKSHLRSQQLAAEQREVAMTTQQMEAFRADPANPHFEEVRHFMGTLIREEDNGVTTLEDAYKKACWANDDVRTKLQTAQRETDEATRRQTAEAKAAEARKAAGANLSTRGAGAGTTPAAQSMEEEMGATYDQMQGAA